MKRLVKIALLGCLISFTASPAYAAYYGGYYGHHYGGYYGRHYGGYPGHRYGYRYRHYRPYYGPAYRYHGGHYGSRGRHAYHGGLVHGLVSIPGTVLGTVFGHHGAYDDDRRYDGTSAVSKNSRESDTATNPASGASAYNGDSGAPRADPQSAGSAVPDSAMGPGWGRLADGDYSRALSIFAGEAQSQPSGGEPKVGFALSAAAGGDLQRGAWAMRRAFRIDPDGLHYITVNDSLRPRVAQLLERYRETLDGGMRDPDAAFMAASLYYLLGDMDAAQAAIEAAGRQGDDAASTANLRRLIDQQRQG